MPSKCGMYAFTLQLMHIDSWMKERHFVLCAHIIITTYHPPIVVITQSKKNKKEEKEAEYCSLITIHKPIRIQSASQTHC